MLLLTIGIQHSVGPTATQTDGRRDREGGRWRWWQGGEGWVKVKFMKRTGNHTNTVVLILLVWRFFLKVSFGHKQNKTTEVSILPQSSSVKTRKSRFCCLQLRKSPQSGGVKTYKLSWVTFSSLFILEKNNEKNTENIFFRLHSGNAWVLIYLFVFLLKFTRFFSARQVQVCSVRNLSDQRLCDKHRKLCLLSPVWFKGGKPFIPSGITNQHQWLKWLLWFLKLRRCCF